MILSLLLSLAVTLVAEVSVALLLGFRDRCSLLVVFLVNIVTNPVVVYLLNLQYHYGVLLPEMPLTVLLEIGAFVTEALLYRLVFKGEGHVWRLSLILNAASYLLGVVVNILLRQVLL